MPKKKTNRQATQRPDLRERLLADLNVLHIPLAAEQLDAALARAERERLPYVQFLEALLAEPAQQRRERSIARRIREARFREPQTLANFDWEFNQATINRTQIEELATGEFIHRRDNLCIVGQSGVGKSHMIHEPVLQDHRRPQPAAFDRAGDQHRLRRLG